MKCMECPDYKDCRRKNDLRRKRGKCAKAKDNYVPTNADRIRAMTDEELAEWMLNGISTDPCDYCECNNGYCDGLPCRGKADAETIIGWLRQPAGGADDAAT